MNGLNEFKSLVIVWRIGYVVKRLLQDLLTFMVFLKKSAFEKMQAKSVHRVIVKQLS